MEISLQGYRENVATFEASETVKPGDLVKLTANGKVSPCAKDDLFIGVVISVRDGYAAVQLAGYCRLAYEGTQPDLGWQTLSAQGATSMKSDAAGHLCLITDVDTSEKVAGMIL